MRPPLDPTERRDVSALVACAWAFLLICAMSTLVNASRGRDSAGAGLHLRICWAVRGVPGCLPVVAGRLGIAALTGDRGAWTAAAGRGRLPRSPRLLASGNPDEISGTFGENAYQLVFFLLVFGALLAGIFTFEKKRPVARLVPALFVLSLGAIFLAQYWALLLTTFFTIILIAVPLARRGSVVLRLVP